MFYIVPVLFATLMASIDAFVLSYLKQYTLGGISGIYIPIGMIIYGLQPLIFLQALRFENMTVMNILWDLISDVIVSITGVFYFKERISPIKQLALGFAFIAIVLFAYDERVKE